MSLRMLEREKAVGKEREGAGSSPAPSLSFPSVGEEQNIKNSFSAVTEVAPVLPAVRALCSRSEARLRYLSYSAPKP